MQIGTRLRGFAIAAATLLVAAPVPAMAQDDPMDQPVLVVSITNIDRLMKDVNYVAEAMGQKQAGSMFGMMAGSYTQGLDRSRPIGVVLNVVDDAPVPMAFLPTSDIKKTLSVVEPITGPPDDLGDGLLAIAAGSGLMFIQQTDDWAFVSQSRDALQDLPEDPTAWLAGMADDYDLGIRVNVSALTPEQRAQAVESLRAGFNQALRTQPPEQAEQVRQVGEQSLKQLELVINDTEMLQFGFAIQPDNKQLLFESVSVAVAGTDLASIYTDQRSIPSKFGEVIQPGAAGYFHSATSISSKAIEAAKVSLEQATGSVRSALDQVDDLSDEDREELEAFFDRLIQIGVETIEEGKSDAGGILVLDNQELNAATGFFVSDGTKVADLAKELAAKIEAKTGGSANLRFDFDAATYQGVTLHYVATDVPADKEEAQKIFGNELKLTIGTGSDTVYLAVGPQSEKLLKGLIDSAGNDAAGDRPLAQGQVRLLPILEFAQSVKPNEALGGMIDALASSDANGAVSFVSDSIERGSTTQFTIGDGILRAIGAALAAQQPQAEAAF